MDSPLSLTTSIISIISFLFTILIWLGQHLDRAIVFDDEVVTMGLMLVRSTGETEEVLLHSSYPKNSTMGKQLLKMWKLDQDSLSKWREITNLSAANRFLQGASKQDIIWKNSKEVKKLRASISFVTICVLPEQIRQVQGALIEGVNETNRILVDKLDLLRATPSVEETRGGRPEEEHAESSTGQAIEFLGENYEKKPEEQPKENPEEPSEKQSHTQSNEHSRPHSKSSSKSSNPPTPPVGGTPLNEGSSQPAGSFPTFSLGAGMTARLAPINHQLTALTSSQSLPLPQSVPLRQSVPSLPSQFSLRTQIRATREELVKELDRFIRFEKIQPSQWSGLVLLLALFLLGRQGVTTEFERAQAKEIKGQGRREDRSSMEDGDSSGAGSIWNARRNTMHSDRFQVVVGSM